MISMNDILMKETAISDLQRELEQMKEVKGQELLSTLVEAVHNIKELGFTLQIRRIIPCDDDTEIDNYEWEDYADTWDAFRII